MKNIAIVGAGISGLVFANEISKFANVTIFEKANDGGIAYCKNINDKIFHICGGHIWNTKYDVVKKWFNKNFNIKDFYSIERNASIFLENRFIGYPIEDNIYQLDEKYVKKIINEILNKNKHIIYENLDQMCIDTFGDTLNKLYFKPYNSKIWGMNTKDIDIAFLNGKFPILDIQQIIVDNILRKTEKQFVHSSFLYPKKLKQNFIIQKFSNKFNIIHKNIQISDLNNFDFIVYTGRFDKLNEFMNTQLLSNNDLSHLKYHGTTSVFCEFDSNPYSWIYFPEKKFKCHRIICTENFIKSNNSRITGTLEYTNNVSIEEIENDIRQLPFNIKFLDINRTECSYPIHDSYTKNIIDKIRKQLELKNIFLLGRFGEWEYYNMDVCILKVIELVNSMLS